MNTEQFIRESAARGLSRRATRLALGIGPWVFREMLTLMPDIEWPARGCSADHQRANEQKRGHCTPVKPLHWSSDDANPGKFQFKGTDKASPNNHPTVKPTALMAYYVCLDLVSTETGLRRNGLCGVMALWCGVVWCETIEAQSSYEGVRRQLLSTL